MPECSAGGLLQGQLCGCVPLLNAHARITAVQFGGACRLLIVGAMTSFAQCFPSPFPSCAVVDEQSKVQIKEALLQYDRTLLVADPRRCEPKK